MTDSDNKNVLLVEVITEDGCNFDDGEYRLSILEIVNGCIDGTDHELALECIEENLTRNDLPKEGPTLFVLTETGEQEDVFWRKYYEITKRLGTDEPMPGGKDMDEKRDGASNSMEETGDSEQPQRAPSNAAIYSYQDMLKAWVAGRNSCKENGDGDYDHHPDFATWIKSDVLDKKPHYSDEPWPDDELGKEISQRTLDAESKCEALQAQIDRVFEVANSNPGMGVIMHEALDNDTISEQSKIREENIDLRAHMDRLQKANARMSARLGDSTTIDLHKEYADRADKAESRVRALEEERRDAIDILRNCAGTIRRMQGGTRNKEREDASAARAFAWLESAQGESATAEEKKIGSLTIDEMRGIVEAATPGPWESFRMVDDAGVPMTQDGLLEYLRESLTKGGIDIHFVHCEKPDGPADVCITGNGPTSVANGRLIALARTAMPELLDALEEASGEEVRLSNMLGTVQAAHMQQGEDLSLARWERDDLQDELDEAHGSLREANLAKNKIKTHLGLCYHSDWDQLAEEVRKALGND